MNCCNYKFWNTIYDIIVPPPTRKYDEWMVV